MIKFIDILQETKNIATDYQFTPKQYKLLRDYGAKESISGRELYLPLSIIDALNKNQKQSTFKQEFTDLSDIENRSMASQVLTAMKKAISMGGTATIGDKKYFVLKGHLSKNNNFSFPNPYRVESGHYKR